MVFQTFIFSDGFVWVEHDSDFGAHGSCWEILSEGDSDSTEVSVSLDNSTPVNSESGVVDGVLCSEDVCDSLSEIESSSGQVVAVLDGNQSLTTVLGSS